MEVFEYMIKYHVTTSSGNQKLERALDANRCLQQQQQQQQQQQNNNHHRPEVHPQAALEVFLPPSHA